MFAKNTNYQKWIVLILTVIPCGFLVYWIFEKNDNVLLIIVALSVLPIWWIFCNWSISRSTPDLDDPRNIGNSATVIEDFKKIGNHFEGYIKLNGVKWKAQSKSFPLEAGTVVITKSLNGLIYEVEKQENN